MGKDEGTNMSGIKTSVLSVCQNSNENLCIRFYGHHKTGFDCSILRKLPNVKSLLLNCLQSVKNFHELKNLKNLEKLNIGVHGLDETEFLSWENLKSISYLCLVGTRKNNFNLKHLEDYRKLKTLFLNGHTKNIESIGKLSNLVDISLSIPSKASIDFINSLSALKKLRLILGGRANFNEVNNYLIEELEIVRVKGFSSFDNISEFRKLKSLVIEDQIQLKSLEFNQSIPELTDLKLINCKTLSRIEGTQNLTALSQLRIYKTAVDFEEFKKHTFPLSLKIFAFYTTKNALDIKIHRELKDMGYVDGLER